MHIEKLKSTYGQKIFKDINQHLEKYKENDIYGSPIIFEFIFFGHIAPTTIKYISDAIDIEKNILKEFGLIVEIGGGYGGLLKTISVNIRFKKYILIDIPEALILAKTYISHFKELDNKVEYISSFDREKIKKINNIDLIIGVCSIAELSEENQIFYLNYLLKRAKNIFLVYNTLHIYRSLYYKSLFSLMNTFRIKIEPFNNTKYLYFKQSNSTFLLNVFSLIYDEFKEFIFRIKRFLKRIF